MPVHRLRDFIALLEQKGDLKRIRVEVDPLLEITEITTRVVKEKGPALLFENVKGSSFPLLINVLGAERRVEWALGRKPAEVGHELGTLAEELMPPSPRSLWRHRRSLLKVAAMKPKKVGSPAVTSHRIEPADMDRLPIAQSWPKDGGRFITFPLVVTRDPEKGKQNMGIYRMHVYGKDQTGMHWQIGKGGGYHYQKAEAKNQPLPVSVVLGADPLLMMAGVLPLPEGLDEMTFTGFLRGSSTRVGQLKESQLTVPAEAEFILEGFVPPQERRMEGPYGDHFGHYSLAAEFPVFHVQRIWHRPDPIFPIAVVGKPPQEDQVLGDAVQEILLPLLKTMHPEIRDAWAYQEAGFHNLLVLSVKQRFAKEAVKSALWALGEGQLSLTKVVITVDPDVDARDFKAVLRAIRKNFDPKSDFILLPGTSQDTLDFTSFKMNLGSKMILDATSAPGQPPSKNGSIRGVEGLSRDIPGIESAVALEDTLLVVQTRRPGREILEKMISFEPVRSFSMIAAVSPDVPLNDLTLLIWGLFTRFDCHRDTFFASARMEKGHPVYEGSMFIDATWKPGYPDPLEMDPAVVKKVDSRWREYGF